MYTYNFITLNAGNMIADNNYEIEEFQKGDAIYAYAKFQYDLSANSPDIREIVLNEMEQQDNALFYQLGQCKLIKVHKDFLKKVAAEKMKKYKPQDALREFLVYVDFESIFKDKYLNMPLSNEYKNQTKEKLKSNNDLAFRLRWMFDPENGIRLSFDGKDKNDKTKVWRTFVPFDKSGSMSRNNQITFIDKDLKAEVEKRLLLDMRFYKNNPNDASEEYPIRVISSQYYAYRGLYLSTGFRIIHNRKGFAEAELCLNHETVIVIPDEVKKLTDKKLFVAETKDPNHCNENSLWQFKETLGGVESNFFDGEGLICRTYTKFINEQLKSRYKFKKESHSFQIRMPFAKGMLHEVNFQLYLDDQLAKSIFKDTLRRNDPLWIEDIFKIKRDLRKAKIILTKSMFKCAGWLEKWRQYAEEGKTILFASQNDLALVKKDPMEYYFEKMQKYKHALYITNADSRLSDDAKVRLNYQFLSTLALPPDDFEEMIREQIDYIKDLPERLIKLNHYEESIEIDEDNFLDEDENPLQQKKKENLNEKCLKALAKSKAFYNDPQIGNIIKSERKNLEKNFCLGRFTVSGEQRFLSGDLLELLRIIYQRFAWAHYKTLYGKVNETISFKIKKLDSKTRRIITNKNVTVDSFFKRYQLARQLNNLKKERLYARHFFMPEKTMTLYPHYDYAFFRNPHLARNEQCLLRPYMKKNSLYNRYFQHLTGVAMISCESLVAIALSGADFDGDLIKIVCDDRIIRAIQKSTYKEVESSKATNENDQKKNKKKKSVKYERVLPVIVIPKLNVYGDTDPGSIPFKTIRNTFSNQIGQISNTAIKFARKEYEYKIKDNSPQQESNLTEEELLDGKCCAACTIVTGLEIDAAKTGIHPKANINALQSGVDYQDPFLGAKAALKLIYKEGRFITPFITEENGRLTGHETKHETKGIKGLINVPVYDADYFTATSKTGVVMAGNKPIANIDWLPGRYLKYFKDAAEENDKKNVTGGNNILFAFQTVRNWESKLLPATKAKVYPLVEAYLKICKLASEINKTKYFLAEQKYIRYVKTMLNIQYDSIRQNLKYDSVDNNGKIQIYEVPIQDALEQTYATLYATIEKNAARKFEEKQQIAKRELRLDDFYRDEITEVLERFIKYNWQYTTTEAERKECIKDIIAFEKENDLPAAMIKLLVNFRNEGHMIFYYILKDIQNHYNTKIDSEAYLRYMENKEEENIENEEGTTDIEVVSNELTDAITENTKKSNYYDELYAIYSELSTRKKVEWKKDIVEKCREKLQEIFKTENATTDETAIMDMALKYVFSIPRSQSRAKGAPKRIIDAQRRFLWDVFTAKEILQNIYEPQKTNCIDQQL